MNKQILILGGSGLVGITLNNLLKQNNKIISTYYQNKFFRERFKLNINSEKELENIFQKTNPDIVINLSGIYKSLTFCEKNKKLSMNVNGLALEKISFLAKKFNSFLVTISTDQVFDGFKGNYKESDKINPINHYGKTKAIGEEFVRNITKKYCIIRTSMLWGKNDIRNTFSEFVLNEVKNKKTINLIQDQFTTPTYLENFCHMLSEVIEKEISGIIHLSGPEKISRYEFGKEILEASKLDQWEVTMGKKLEFDFGKYMPKDTSLNTEKASKLLKIKPEKIKKSLQKYFDNTIM
jgi:dTDP-4-dehydrorhamnose reductase